MRALGIVFGGPPGAISGGEGRLRGFAATWATQGSVDWVLGGATRAATQSLLDALDPAPASRVLRLEAPAPYRARRWRLGRRDRHEGPRQASSVPALLGAWDPTVGRHQVAKALHDHPYDLVWCADPVALAFYGKVRRDVPVVLDMASPASDRGDWHRLEQHLAASAHLVTVPSGDARERLGVPGALVVNPDPDRDSDRDRDSDLDRSPGFDESVIAFLDAVATMCRWSEDFHGVRR